MNISLPLAIFWMLLGIAILAWHVYNPQGQVPLLPGTGINAVLAYWACFLLAAYNVVRWWASRAFRARRQALEPPQDRPRPAPPPRERDPNFDFTEPSPPADEEGPRPAP